MTNKAFILLGLAAAATGTARAQFTLESDSTGLSVDLEETTVVAQKRVVKMETDKVTYSVEADADAKASTILDMLRKVPMVVVDGQDNITVAGSSSFKVFLNGRPNQMLTANASQAFKSMPAAMVKNIEVITNPGAKYDAEGTGGILNITLRSDLNMSMMGGGDTNLDGINGNVSVNGGNKGGGGSFYIGGNKGKLSFSANANFNLMVTKGTDFEMLQEQYSPVASTSRTTQDGGDTNHKFTMGNFSLGYDIDERNSLNATFGLHSFAMVNRGSFVNTFEGPMYGPGFALNGSNDVSMDRLGLNTSVDYMHYFDAERKSSMAVTYQYSTNPTNNDTEGLFDNIVGLPAEFAAFIEDRYSYNHERSDEHNLQVDFITPIAEGQKLNSGVKLSRLHAESASDYYREVSDHKELIPALCSNYFNNRNIAAGYAEYEAKKDKWSGRAGLRYEHTWQDVDFHTGNGEDFDTNYGNFVPSATLSYAFMPMANIGLSYNMRISRPGITYLNPYVDRSSNTAVTYGNPDLDVEKSHNTGLVFNFFTPMLVMNLNVRYSLTPNAIEKYSFFPTDDVLLHTTYGNIVKRQQTSFTLFTTFLAAKNTRIIANLGATYADFRSKELDVQNSGWQRNMMLGLQQTLPQNWKCSAFCIMNSKTYTLQGWNGGFKMLMANVSKSWRKDKYTLALQGMTGLNKGGCFRIQSYSASNDFVNSMDITAPAYGGTLTFTYTFGNSKVKTRTHDSKVKSDVMEQRGGMEQIGNMGGGAGTGTGIGGGMPH